MSEAVKYVLRVCQPACTDLAVQVTGLSKVKAAGLLFEAPCLEEYTVQRLHHGNGCGHLFLSDVMQMTS